MPGEGIRVLEFYEDDIVESAGGEFFSVPAVAVTNRYIKRKRKIALKKRNLLVRDHKTCQYCGQIVKPQTATIDHIRPKSSFANPKAAHTWENIVIACFPCNSRKDNRTPEQADMKLLTTPVEPDHATFYAGMSPWRSMPEEWKTYVRT
jgi:uncharacterized protein (TIGR02646 family)